jgi:hypothetical protein
MPKNSIENIVDNDPKNLTRFQFLSELDLRVSSEGPLALQQVVTAFVREQKSSLLNHLRKPEHNELKLLTDETVAIGGLEFLQNTYLSPLSEANLALTLFQDCPPIQCFGRPWDIGGVCAVFA